MRKLNRCVLLFSIPLHPRSLLAGMVRVAGLLPTGCKMLDTPGVPHAFQVRSAPLRACRGQHSVTYARNVVATYGASAAWALVTLAPTFSSPCAPAAGQAPDSRRDAHGAATPPAQAAHLPNRRWPGAAPRTAAGQAGMGPPPGWPLYGLMLTQRPLLLPQTIMIGGLARVDVVSCPGATLYLSVFVSDEIGCHLGKTDGADARCVPPAIAMPPGQLPAQASVLLCWGNHVPRHGQLGDVRGPSGAVLLPQPAIALQICLSLRVPTLIPTLHSTPRQVPAACGRPTGAPLGWHRPHGLLPCAGAHRRGGLW